MVAQEPARPALLIVLIGATASGKTALALRMAQELGGEIISCDSVAVYRLMEAGTAKPSARERSRVRHHCLDLYWPNQTCTAGDYARHARAALDEVCAREMVPIVAGGTGLYMRAFLEGLAPSPPRDEALRERLRGRAERHGSQWLHRALQRVDPASSKLIHPNDVPKLIRSLEVAVLSAQPQSEQWAAGRDPLQGFRILKFGLAPDRKLLHERINARASAMFAQGLVQETRMLRQTFGEDCRALGSLGYAQARAMLRGELTEAEAISAAQAGHRQYAKRQMTWFRREPSISWMNGFGDNPEVQEEVLQQARRHLQWN